MSISVAQAAPFGGAFFLTACRRHTLKIFTAPAKLHPGRLASFLCATFFGLCPVNASAVTAALAGSHTDYKNISPYATEDKQTADSSISKEIASEEISGSRFPGCLNHLLTRPFDEQAHSSPQVHINYPSTGNRVIDADIRQWVANLADIFSRHMEILQLPTDSEDPDLAIDRFLNDNDLNLPAEEDSAPGELWGDYDISFPSENAISITFEIWNNTGNGQTNLDILTLNYNKLNGQRLELVDIFEQPDLALRILSRFSREELEKRGGTNLRSKMIQDGTEPLPENFASLTLTSTGLRINFQPYQVAPGDAGMQKIEIPLAELLSAGPLLTLWNK